MKKSFGFGAFSPSPSSKQPSPGYGARRGLTREEEMEVQLALILALLFCVFICLMALHSLLLYIHRRRRERLQQANSTSSSSSTAVAVRKACRGLHKDAIEKALPPFMFGSEYNAGEDCAICLCEIEQGEVVRRLPVCSHTFHLNCIDQWLCSCATCPTCRCSIFAKHKQSDSEFKNIDESSSCVVVFVVDQGEGETAGHSQPHSDVTES